MPVKCRFHRSTGETDIHPRAPTDSCTCTRRSARLPDQLTARSPVVLLQERGEPAGQCAFGGLGQRLPGHHREGPVVGEALGHHQQAYGRLRVQLRVPLGAIEQPGPQRGDASSRSPGSRGTRPGRAAAGGPCPAPARRAGRRLATWSGVSAYRTWAIERRRLGDDRPRLHPGGLHAGEADGAHLRDRLEVRREAGLARHPSPGPARPGSRTRPSAPPKDGPCRMPVDLLEHPLALPDVAEQQ